MRQYRQQAIENHERITKRKTLLTRITIDRLSEVAKADGDIDVLEDWLGRLAVKEHRAEQRLAEAMHRKHSDWRDSMRIHQGNLDYFIFSVTLDADADGLFWVKERRFRKRGSFASVYDVNVIAEREWSFSVLLDAREKQRTEFEKRYLIARSGK